MSSRSAKSRLLVILALCRELVNRISYYRKMIEQQIAKRRDVLSRIENLGAVDKSIVKHIEKDIVSLENVLLNLDRLEKDLERASLRLETLIMVGNVGDSLSLIRDVVKMLKSSSAYVVPSLSIVVDRIERIYREIARLI